MVAQFDKLAEKAADYPQRPFTVGECRSLLYKAGFELQRQTATSHAFYIHRETGVQFEIVEGKSSRELLHYERKDLQAALRKVAERTVSLRIQKALTPLKAPDKPKNKGMDL